MDSTIVFSTAFSPSSRISLHLRSRPPPFSTAKYPLHKTHFFSPPPITTTTTTSSSNPLRLRSSLLTPLAKPIRPFSASSSNDDNSITEPPKTQLQGAKIVPLALSLAIGIVVRFFIPKPVEVTEQAWQLLSIFLSTIAGLVLSPLPVGAWAFLGLTTTVLTKTLTFETAFSAFTNEVIWLIVISFFFARGFVKTGLGDRIATYFVKWLGKSTLGLSYGLTLSEALIAPAMPSTTARAGGVFLPIIKSLSLSAGSKPNHPSARKLGSYLIQSQLQCAGNSSALFLTAAAQNLLCLKLAEELGVVIADPIRYANVVLTLCRDATGISSVVTAMLALSVLLLLGVLNWDDCLTEKSAWDTLAWFAVLVGMAAQLTNLGIVTWMSNCVASSLKSLSLSWPAAFSVLQAAYFLIHYMFASQTGHVGALYSAFLAMNLAAGVPGALAALALAYNTNLFGALTHYSSGQAAVYFGAGYVDLPDVFRLGFIMGCVNAVIWVVVGGFWWKFLGLY
ncbi:Sodium/sulfate symporter [Cynara cardunculus var. scolymus]|uniref:Sodium/sulfate symporter n=1 Tax=Cynara cardunculus var. scolymus TaxID=59895 RepID=A0A103XMD5_CYNCS|nr:Sodium/sulfate symporter [Cynara cardunculus var. scolymus]